MSELDTEEMRVAFGTGNLRSESRCEELHENQNTDGLKSRHSSPSEAAYTLFCCDRLYWKLSFREMMLIFGLMLLQTAACMEFTCRFNQADPCYAALGHTLNLLMVDTREYDLKIRKRVNNSPDDPVCRVKNDRIRKSECDLFKNRSEVTVINGTLIIKRVISTDSGNYTVGLQVSDGTVTYADLQVNVEAPIGSVNVSFNCSSNGVKTVSCSSDGDQLIYNWTLNGDPLMDRNANIHLNETTDGEISCSVKNHVSLGQKNINVNCPGSPTAAVTSSLTSTLTSSTPTSEHDDGSVWSVRRFSHLHETRIRKETGRSKTENEEI
ncbi:uncharacterized protein [Pseudorasbora parva]|uniref:uncharacterized protein n=1 Tax=Pseudorasbora parva TaxID=51549 RepID=UPI00351F5417